MFSFFNPQAPQSGGADRHLLWIDRVGCWMLMLKNEVTIGGPGHSGQSADLALMAQLSRKHVSLYRDGESYVLKAHGPASVAGRPVHDRADLHDGYELLLGNNVRMRFRLPTVMSGSARLEFLSDHRPRHAVEGVVLMDDTCLLGPHADNHILCPGWPAGVVLFRKQGQLWCKSRGDLAIAGRQITGTGVIPPGAVVQGSDFRFRVEPVS